MLKPDILALVRKARDFVRTFEPPLGDPAEVLLPAPKERGLFKAKDGTSIYYETHGAGQPLVFCYGLTCRREHWRHQLLHFAKKYRVILFDYRGHSGSAIPDNDRNLTLAWCARDFQSLLDFLGLDKVVVFGHSMGVPVAAQAALLEPKRVVGEVLICGGVHDPFEHMFYTNRLRVVQALTSQMRLYAPDVMEAAWHQFTKQNIVNWFLTARFGFNRTIADPRDIRGYMQGVHDTPHAIFQALLDDYVRYDGRAGLRQIECPVLLVAGEADWITPIVVQEEMTNLLPHGELLRVPMGSHNAHMDFPELVNQSIDGFLERLGYR